MHDIGTIIDTIASVAKMNGAIYALLFGSYARGTATRRSDIDVIFVEETDDSYLQRLERYLRPLVTQLNTAVEVFVYTPREFESRQKSRSSKRQFPGGLWRMSAEKMIDEAKRWIRPARADLHAALNLVSFSESVIAEQS